MVLQGDIATSWVILPEQSSLVSSIYYIAPACPKPSARERRIDTKSFQQMVKNLEFQPESCHLGQDGSWADFQFLILERPDWST
jgi:hypothetical protein